MSVRTRFAPSPTGSLHIGGVRTALFSYLFARHHGGRFVLRIEDTDRERSTPESIQTIVESLTWLGLTWDEGPYFQSARSDLYRARAEELLAAGHLYRCYCTPAELEERRAAARAAGRSPRYDGRCRTLTPEERQRFEAEGRTFALRFRMPGTDVTVVDLIKGTTVFPAADLEDFVIVRSDGTPTYLFASAADDVPDKQGRITIPTALREYAGLERECTVIGANTRAEIWDARAWATYSTEQEQAFADLSEEVVPGLM